jgi:hypothetical protein
MVPISPEVFSGGAVVFDTRSLFDYQQKLADRRAKREAAEQEALDSYLKELSKTPDPYGMRKNDIGAFNQKLDDFRELSNEFRKAPKSLEGRLKLQQAADDLKLFVARSKAAKEDEKSYNQLLSELATNPEKRKSTDIERLMMDKANQDLPLDFNAPMLGFKREDKEFNPNYYTPPPVSTYDLFEKNKGGIDFGPGTRISQTDKDFNYIQEKKYSPEGIETIAIRIGDRVAKDADLASSYKVKGRKYSDEELTNFKAMLQKYPKLKDIDVDDDNPVSIAIAEAVLEGEARKKQEKVIDTRAKKSYESSLIASRQGAGGGAVNLLDYDLLGKYTPESKYVTRQISPTEKRAMPTDVIYVKNIPSQELELITNKGQVYPYSENKLEYFVVRPDGNWEGFGGQVIDRSAVARANLDKTSLSEERRLRQGIISPVKQPPFKLPKGIKKF